MSMVEMKKHGSIVPGSSKTQFDDSETDQEDEEKEIEQKLAEAADATFENLQKARSNGERVVFQKLKEEKKSRRANKNRPMEVTSKKPVPIFREVVQAPKNVVRDPRFESLCGRLDPNGFKNRYNFLFESDLPAEKEALLKELKKYKDPKMINEIEERISGIDKLLKSNSSKCVDSEILAKHKKNEREAAKQGKRPFYLKKSEIRKQRLVEKYNDLKSSGKLEAFIQKRRKRNTAKDRKYMPYRRSSDNAQ